ncbi:hypothetical protein STCU_11972 [Strigomonas culicis]|uniref:Uncharacterized protein n=1 Tax=Strigomonas culicis TaxID=28005 RepID=S9UY88_9TRYP|nr:hypothetical protein STCU_11972 [Strigomonas culicis]|eukprot:EPY15500.1 hypothetical protein STCU_11972 [Strigomonas culicis]
MDVPRRKALIEAHMESFKYFTQASISQEGKGRNRLLDWLPAKERLRIVSQIPGELLSKVVMRAFNNCSLVAHETFHNT